MEIHRLSRRGKRQQLHEFADNQQKPTEHVWYEQSTTSKEKLFKEVVNTFIKEYFWHYLQLDNFDNKKDTKIFIWVIIFGTRVG